MILLLGIFMGVSLTGWCAFVRAQQSDRLARDALKETLALYEAGAFLRRHDPYLPDGRTWKRGEEIPPEPGAQRPP